MFIAFRHCAQNTNATSTCFAGAVSGFRLASDSFCKNTKMRRLFYHIRRRGITVYSCVGSNSGRWFSFQGRLVPSPVRIRIMFRRKSSNNVFVLCVILVIFVFIFSRIDNAEIGPEEAEIKFYDTVFYLFNILIYCPFCFQAQSEIFGSSFRPLLSKVQCSYQDVFALKYKKCPILAGERKSLYNFDVFNFWLYQNIINSGNNYILNFNQTFPKPYDGHQDFVILVKIQNVY